MDCGKVGNNLVFTGQSPDSRLLICKEDGTVVHSISLSYRPLYVTEVDSNTVAVSCTLDKTILIIDVSTGSISSSIETSDFCDGISYADNFLYVVIEGSSIQEMDLIGTEKRTIRLPVNRITSINVLGNKVVCIDTSKIFCFSLDGEFIWEFSSYMFSYFDRLTTDNAGNVYVTHARAESVVVVSCDGKYLGEIVYESLERFYPFSLHFCKKEIMLMVCPKYKRKCLLFDA